MKATGIVRRIDDLGRIVIPKEIRRTLRIRESDPLEIFTDREGEIILKKYSPIGEKMCIRDRYKDGAVLFSPWPWLGQAAYNVTEHVEEGKGFMAIPVADTQIYSWGCYAKDVYKRQY